MTASTCVWCAVAFLGVNIQHSPAAQARWGWVGEEQFYHGSSWGLISNAFVHQEPLHLIFNLYWMWILGGAFERTFGPVRMLLFMLVSAFVSSGLQIYDGLGIGLSGIGYALFGFGWVGRKRYPEFARTVTPMTIQMFVIWGVLCVFMTSLHVGNIAHASGLAVGATIAGLILKPVARIPLTAGLAIMSTAAVASIFWNPRSLYWVLDQADAAEAKHQYARAIELYNHSLDVHANPAYSLSHLAEIYAIQGQKSEFRTTIGALKSLGDPVANDVADELIKKYGDPDKTPQGQDHVK